MQNAERAVLVDGLEDILGLAGRSLGPSDWVDVTQGNVNAVPNGISATATASIP